MVRPVAEVLGAAGTEEEHPKNRVKKFSLTAVSQTAFVEADSRGYKAPLERKNIKIRWILCKDE